MVYFGFSIAFCVLFDMFLNKYELAEIHVVKADHSYHAFSE